jgi:WD40 repeat protein
MSIFPSGNLISISKDKSIKIWDIELNLLQRIQEENLISDINIKDENNFIICTLCFIKIYFRNNNKFEIKDIIKNILNSNFIKVKYFPEEKIFSSSIDNKIII